MALAIIHRSRNLSLTCGTYHCGENVENAVEEMDNRILKETRCHSETIKVPLGDNKGATLGKVYLRSLIWSGLMYPPFWFSMLESKKVKLILLEGNLRSLSQEGLVISSKLSHTIFTLDSTTCNMEGHVKLVNRLSDPSDRLIHRISHPSKEQTSAELNLSCFICIWVHGFSVCNPHFCKKNSHGIKGPSDTSS